MGNNNRRHAGCSKPPRRADGGGDDNDDSALPGCLQLRSHVILLRVTNCEKDGTVDVMGTSAYTCLVGKTGINVTGVAVRWWLS